MKPFVINRYGRLVFPSCSFVDIDFSVFETLDQVAAVIKRDFEAKAPTSDEIATRVEASAYESRFELLVDLGQHLFWVNRYALPMYDKRPTRWRDVPRRREDVFVPLLTPWSDGDRQVAVVEAAYQQLPTKWDAAAEDEIFRLLFDVFRNKLHDATEVPAIKPTVAEFLADPDAQTFVLSDYEPDYRMFTDDEVIDYQAGVPELEALGRWSMIIHNQYPWDQSKARLATAAEIADDEFVVLFEPRGRQVMEFISRVKAATPARSTANQWVPLEARRPVRPYPPVIVADHFKVAPRLEALAVAKGEVVCSNDDIIRNSAPSWSPMSAKDIFDKTGIEQRTYTERSLESLALDAAAGALVKAGRQPDEIGAVLFCSCTSNRRIPSVACWLSGQLGMLQTRASNDIIAACAGFPYGVSEAVRLLQEVDRPVLVVFAEKFSDKIGTVRTSRMLFGDAAAAAVFGPAPGGLPGDVEVLQTYASGPVSEVNSILWPNPDFDNNITVYGPEVKKLAQRYIIQMMDELRDLSGPDGTGAMVDAIDLVVPHQANRTMIMQLATNAGVDPDQLYFDIASMGNVSAASIPVAIYDAVADGVIDRPMRVFTPGFGAGAVGGYVVLRVDPAVMAEATTAFGEPASDHDGAGTTLDDLRLAFGE
jgi:3-oxoacyl-[acyl-carrier-protein] synthase III